MVSVCIASFNGEEYISDQLKSILSQLSKYDEIIISDDESSDDTLKKIVQINDKRIRVISHKKNRICHRSASYIYTSANFENCIREARGDIIILSDQDDIWLPNKVETITSYLQNVNLVMSNFNLCNSIGIITSVKYFKKSPISSNFIMNLIRMPYFGCAIGFRKELLPYILPFPPNLISHDNWIGLISQVYFGKPKFIKAPLFNYRRHDDNTSSATGKSTNPIWYKIFHRLLLLSQIIKRIIYKKLWTN